MTVALRGGVVKKLTDRDKDGNLRVWRLVEGSCPDCEELCTIKVPESLTSDEIIHCYSCGYRAVQNIAQS